jgi:hypothetical protein
MGSSEGRAERSEALRGLLERLCAPDLTPAEAKPPRTRLFDLLEPAGANRPGYEARGGHLIAANPSVP